MVFSWKKSIPTCIAKNQITIYNMQYIMKGENTVLIAVHIEMKNRKSLLATYIKIILVIAVIGAIIYGIIRVVGDKYNEEEFETVKTNMLLIQGKTEVIAQKVDIEEKGAEYIGTEIKEKENDEKIQNLINNEIIDIDSKKSTYYCLDNSALEELELDITTDDYYIVDYKKNDVIYVDGIVDKNGNVVYKLSEME